MPINGKDAQAANTVVTSISAFYSIFLGFIIYILWSNYQNSSVIITTEASKLSIVKESAKAFPPIHYQNIIQGLTLYVSSILDDELIAMSTGNASPNTQENINNLYDLFLKFRPTGSTSIETIYYTNAVSALNQAIEYRNFRLNMLHIVIPVNWYLIVFFGAFLIIGIYSQTYANVRHFLVVLCVFLAFYTTAITTLSFPFSGVVKVSDEPYRKVLNNLKDSTHTPYHGI